MMSLRGMLIPFGEALVVCAALAGLFLFVGDAQAQRGLPENLQQALELIEEGRYEEALAEAETYLENERDDRYNAAAQLIAGRCEVNLGMGQSAIRRAFSSLDRFGETNPMAAQTFYLLATAFQETGDNYEASRALIRCLDSDPDDALRVTALNHLSDLARGPVAYRASQLRLIARSEDTRQAIDLFLPRSASIPTFGLLVPESEEVRDPGLELIEGFRSALEKWRATRGLEAELVVKRVPRGGPHAVHAARNLVRNSGVWGLVVGGPEEMVIPAVVEAQAAGVPVILPAQRRPGTDALGPDVLLPEADWRTEGRIAANYAVDSLGLKVFGIVAPYTDQGREVVHGFREVLDARDSVEVLAQEWYFAEEGVSLARQFQRVRTIGFRREFLDSLRQMKLLPEPRRLAATLDSLGYEQRLSFLDSLRVNPEPFRSLITPLPHNADSVVRSITRHRIDSLFSRIDSVRFERMWVTHLDSIKRTIAFKTGQIDSNDIELKVFDALYLPIEPGTISLFAPQFAFYDFRATRLGNAAWYNPDDLYRNRQYVENMIFTSPYRLDGNDGEMGELMMFLHRIGGGAVTPWHVRGYDAGNILLEMVAGGRLGAGDVADGLHTLTEIPLAAGHQRFEGGSLVGRQMWLLTARNGVVVTEDVGLRRLMLTPPPADSTGADLLEMHRDPSQGDR